MAVRKATRAGWETAASQMPRARPMFWISLIILIIITISIIMIIIIIMIIRPVSVLRFWTSEGLTRAEHKIELRWNSHVQREFPRSFESTNLSRDNLSREIGRTRTSGRLDSGKQTFSGRSSRGPGAAVRHSDFRGT